MSYPSPTFSLLALSEIQANYMTQNSQMQFLNALTGLIPWSSQCSLVRKGIEKAIFCFSAWVGGKHSKFHLL